MSILSEYSLGDFIEKNIGRAPFVFKNPLAQPLVTIQELLAIVRTSFIDPLEKQIHIGNRVWMSGLRQIEDLEKFLPTDLHRCLDDYFGDLNRDGIYDLCISAWSLHTYSDDLYERVAEFSETFTDALGLPTGGINTDVFLGDYRRTPAGLHIDGTDVFSYVVAGRKRMLVWPFEVFESFSAKKKGQFDILRNVDYSLYRDQAIILDGEPGDILYWPATYWHVAEGNGEGVATFNISHYIESKDRFIEDSLKEFLGPRNLFQSYFRKEELDESRVALEGNLKRIVDLAEMKRDKFKSLKGIVGFTPNKIISEDNAQSTWRLKRQWPLLYRETSTQSVITSRGRSILLPRLRFFFDFSAFLQSEPWFNLDSIAAHYGLEGDSEKHLIRLCDQIIRKLSVYGSIEIIEIDSSLKNS